MVREPALRRLTRLLLRGYMRVWHAFEVHDIEHLPRGGPALILLNHASLVDIPALLAIDPYPDTAMIAKASLLRLPILGGLLREWGAIGVERQGRDSAGVRALLTALRDGRVVAVAAEGRRTRSGHLEAIHPVLAKIAATVDVPLVPLGISGSFAALPPGAVFPRRRRVVLRVGPPFRLPPGTQPAQAAERIQAEIAALLPPEQRPLRGTPTPQPPPRKREGGVSS